VLAVSDQRVVSVASVGCGRSRPRTRAATRS